MGFQNQRVRRIKVEQIPGYDDWKTTPPDAPDPVTYCNGCGCELYEDDVIYDIDGGICEDCLNDRYRKEIRRIV